MKFSKKSDARSVTAERDAGKTPETVRVFQKAAIEHPDYGLILVERLAIKFKINIETKVFQSMAEAASSIRDGKTPKSGHIDEVKSAGWRAGAAHATALMLDFT